jgi:hypothetical protein
MAEITLPHVSPVMVVDLFNSTGEENSVLRRM